MPVSPAKPSAPDPLKIVLTGDPGCGKTTVVRRVVERLRGTVAIKGFVTEEIRERGRRVGFRGVTVGGEVFVLAHVDKAGPYRVGPYGVDLGGLESVGLAALEPDADTALVVLDEIGKMESFSEAFRQRVEAHLDGPVALLATVAKHGVGLPKRVRNDPRIRLVSMSRASRDAAVGEVLRALDLAGAPRAER